MIRVNDRVLPVVGVELTGQLQKIMNDPMGITRLGSFPEVVRTVERPKKNAVPLLG